MHDLSQYNVVKAAQRGVIHNIIAPDGTETPVNIKLVGFDAPEVVLAVRDFDRQQAKTGEDIHPSDLEMRRNTVMVVAAVKDWGGLALEGQEINGSNAFDFLSQTAYYWITQQLHSKGRLRSNFFLKEPKS